MFHWDQDADGIVTLTLDDPTGSVNVMNEHYQQSMRNSVRRLVAERDTITGVVITSAKKTFFAGGDLRALIRIGPEDADAMFATIEAIKADLRTLETLGKPVVAAINGAALGGGLEIALAAHRRIAADIEGVIVGFPEVPIGLMPGGGGVTRTVRMFGIRKAFVENLSQGTRFTAVGAKQVGLVDELVSTVEELVPKAKAWLREELNVNRDGAAVQPWDTPGYTILGGTPSSRGFGATLPGFLALVRNQLEGAPMPAPRAILDTAVEGAQVDFGAASRIESRYFTQLVTGQVAKNMIQASFLDRQFIKAGGSRPGGIAKHEIRKIGLAGAGWTGSGIAHLSAKAGIAVVFEADGAGAGGTQFEGADFVIEAIDVEQESFGRSLAVTAFAAGDEREDDVVGIHVLPPVDEMGLVEIAKGERSSDEALARVFDYVLAIGKTPIVVNDSRDFFARRVIGTFVREALAMLGEGVRPTRIEQAGSRAGYPVPPLQLCDELDLERMHEIAVGTREGDEDAGRAHVPHPAEAVVERMIEIGRPSRVKGAGFYEYADGRRVGLWSGLKDTFNAGTDLPLRDMIDRMLFAAALETQKCIDEGALTSTADANVGSIMGAGFPPWTGGSAQYIVGYEGPAGIGKEAFVARAEELAACYGERFHPPPSLLPTNIPRLGLGPFKR